VLQLQVDGAARRARDEPVDTFQLHSLHALAVDTEKDVANAHLTTLRRRRCGNNLANIDSAACLLIPVFAHYISSLTLSSRLHQQSDFVQQITLLHAACSVHIYSISHLK